MHGSGISIWFFIGVLPIIYGAMISVPGIVEWTTGNNAAGVQLEHLHAPIWWDGLLFALGVFYAVKFPPRRTHR